MNDVKVAIVAAKFNAWVVDALKTGAVETLLQAGITRENIQIIDVPGAFELPLAAKWVAKYTDAKAVIALGAVIRGETPHFDYVAGECAQGLMQVGLKKEIPVIFGVLTVDSIEQATARAGGRMGNKGKEAAQAALEMCDLLRQLQHGQS